MALLSLFVNGSAVLKVEDRSGFLRENKERILFPIPLSTANFPPIRSGKNAVLLQQFAQNAVKYGIRGETGLFLWGYFSAVIYGYRKPIYGTW